MERDATGITIPESTPNGVPKLSANVQKTRDDVRQEQNRRKELYFKASHGLLIGFFLWILYAVLCQ